MAVYPQRASHIVHTIMLAAWTLVGCGIVIYGLVNLAHIIAIPIGVVLWSMVIVFILRRPVNFFERHGVPRAVGTTLAYLLMFLVGGVLSFMLFSPLFGISAQFRNLTQNVPDYITAVNSALNALYVQYADLLQDETLRAWLGQVASSLFGVSSSIASASATSILAAGTSLVNIGITIGFALVIAFWVLVDLPRMGREAYRVCGDKNAHHLKIFHASVTRVMGGYIAGTAIQCLIIGVLSAVLFFILHLESPAALGIVTGILNIIPIVGPWAGGILAALSCVMVSPIAALFALVGTIVIQQLVYTFISPRLMSKSVNIHPILTFTALLAGSALGGAAGGLLGSLIGALLSIPVVAVAKSLFVYYFELRCQRRIVADDGVFFKGENHHRHTHNSQAQYAEYEDDSTKVIMGDNNTTSDNHISDSNCQPVTTRDNSKDTDTNRKTTRLIEHTKDPDTAPTKESDQPRDKFRYKAPDTEADTDPDTHSDKEFLTADIALHDALGLR